MASPVFRFGFWVLFLYQHVTILVQELKKWVCTSRVTCWYKNRTRDQKRNPDGNPRRPHVFPNLLTMFRFSWNTLKRTAFINNDKGVGVGVLRAFVSTSLESFPALRWELGSRRTCVLRFHGNPFSPPLSPFSTPHASLRCKLESRKARYLLKTIAGSFAR